MRTRLKHILLVLESWNVQSHLIPVACVAVARLINTFRSYTNAYFWLDDFKNPGPGPTHNSGQMLGYIVNPVSSYFRPVGMLCYWLLLQFSGLHAAPYHWVAWSLLTANTALVYVILKRLTKARSGAAVGAMLFATEAVFAKMYWDFGTIFELLAGFFCFVGILLWVSERRDWRQVILASLALLLAMKAKEVAVALALAFVIYDLLLWKNCIRTLAAQWLLPCGLSLWYGLTKAAAMREIATTDAYYMTVNESTLVAGFTNIWRYASRDEVSLASLGHISHCASSDLCSFAKSTRTVLFVMDFYHVSSRYLSGESPLCVLLVPSILRCIGPCGDQVTKHVADMIQKRNPRWLAAAGGYCVFALLCFGTFIWLNDATRPFTGSG